MGDQDCNSCGYAIWDSGDRSVGIWTFVADCKCKIPGSQECFDRFNDEPDYQCPFHVMINQSECEKVRCKECNSPNTEYLRPGIEDVFQGIFKCKDCGKESQCDYPI